MKPTIFFVIFILCYFSCSQKNNKVTIDNQLVLEAEKNNALVTAKEDSIPATKISHSKTLSFKFNTDSSGYYLKTINIYSDGILYQKINTNKDIENKKFQLIDWNFDGFKDITVLNNCGSGGCAYWIWNYSLEEEKYIYNKELSEVLGLEIDIPNKFIVFHYRSGYEAEIWDTLKYKNDKLIIVKGLYRERWNDTLGNFWVKNTYKKMVNNAKVIKIDSFIAKE
jgi:hypothetical protein